MVIYASLFEIRLVDAVAVDVAGKEEESGISGAIFVVV